MYNLFHNILQLPEPDRIVLVIKIQLKIPVTEHANLIPQDYQLCLIILHIFLLLFNNLLVAGGCLSCLFDLLLGPEDFRGLELEVDYLFFLLLQLVLEVEDSRLQLGFKLQQLRVGALEQQQLLVFLLV